MITFGLLRVPSFACQGDQAFKKVMVTAQDMSQESHKISVNVDQAHHWPIEPVHAYVCRVY